MKAIKTITLFAALAIFFNSCTSVRQSMREPNVRVELNKDDFDFSSQVSGSAETKRVLGIDWWRLFDKKSGGIASDQATIDLASIPVIGTVLIDATSNYALWEIMQANKGYDVVFYPQYEKTVKRPVLGLGFIYSKTNVTATCRLAKIKK